METAVHPGSTGTEAPVASRSIVILDFGGQYAHLIANRVRRLGAYSEIRVAETPPALLQGAAGIILSGGPQSVYEVGSPQADPAVLALGIPVLGLCYGHQWLAHALKGEVKPATTKEYGHTGIEILATDSPVFAGLPAQTQVWMSHGDEVASAPKGFTVTARSENCEVAAMEDRTHNLYGIQFHIEVTHTPYGMDILRNFVTLCRPAPWSVGSFAQRVGAEIKKDVGDRKVFMLVSGGVDSTVAFTLLNSVLGADRVQGLLVDTGLMRKDEVKMIVEAFRPLRITNLHVEDASAEFFANLKGVYDPEKKRTIIGDTFLAVQKRVSEKMGLKTEDGWILGQGTIYPDTIETGGTRHADHIKTHHNRVHAIQKMIDKGLVIEPLKELYKDEVRMLGEELGLPHGLVWRHPFPGPGLGVRILCAETPDTSAEPAAAVPVPHAVLPVRSVGVQGDGRTYRHALALFSDRPTVVSPDHLVLATSVPNADRSFSRVVLCASHDKVPAFVFTPGYLTRERADLLREADAIAREEMEKAGLGSKIWQYPVVLLPFGTKADGQSIVLRPIASTDAMTANAFVLDEPVLAATTKRLLALQGIDCVFIDLTNKPPGTIEWE